MAGLMAEVVENHVRTHLVDQDTHLYAQFGAGYRQLRDFRAGFIEGMEMALTVYPDAQVSVGEKGITLRPSRPVIAHV